MLAITNAHIITMEEKDYKSGTILIEKGKIKDVGERVEIPSHCKVVDARGNYVLPGFIDAHTHAGIAEEIYQIEGDDTNEITDPLTPHLRALDAINPNDIGFKEALLGGVTTVMVAPGSANVIGGMTALLKVKGKTFQEMIINPEAGLKIALGENPKRVYGEQKKMPYTRMATAALLRQAFIEADNYRRKKSRERDLKKENLVKALNREIPVRAHAHRADDILTALRIGKEFNLRMVIEHCTEGHKILPELLEAGVPVAVGPSLTNRSKVELGELSFKTPGLLAKAGLKVALITDHPVIPVRYLVLCAALAVKEGMEEKEALKALTVNPAKILEIEDRVGSIRPGKDADLVIWSGFPLDIRSNPLQVYINGHLVFDNYDRN
ncbi:MAG: amidohydrolase [Clostridia bacterium]|nr:amidohydrolase [Clostridia bacterium]